MATNREKVKRFVKISNGRYVAPDGRGIAKATNVATAEFCSYC